MKKESLSEQRTKDIVAAFFDGIKGNGQFSVKQEYIIREIMKKGAPRFYVTYERAARFVSIIERGKELPLHNRYKVEMYRELHRRYKEYIKLHGDCGYRILEKIIQQPAPSFYMEVKTFRDIIYENHKRSRRCQQ